MANSFAGGLIGNVVGGSTISLPEVPEFEDLYSLNFDGADDYVSTGYSSGASTGFTISMWIKSSNTSTSMTFASNGTSGGTPGGFQVLSPSGTRSFYILVFNGTSYSVNNNVGGTNARDDICDGAWHHLAVTIDGTAVKIYKDGGDAAGSNTQGTPFATWTSAVSYTGNTGNDYYLGRNGAYTPSANYWMDGNQDEVAFFETALSGAAISAIYNSGTPTDLTSLSPTLWYRMGEDATWDGTNWTIPDASENSNTGTTANMAEGSRVTDVPS